MTKKISKLKKQSKAVARERKALEAENTDIPKTMIFCKPNCHTIVKQLVNDFKSTMEPHTIKEVYCSKSNTLKDYISYATKNHVKNIIYFTHAKSSNKTCDWNESTKYERGGVYCHNIVLPHGPSFTYRVKQFSLKKDIQTLTGFGMNNNYLQKPPLLICEGFGNVDNVEYLKAVSSSFQNMLPTLNINKIQVNSVRRTLLISHQNKMPETDVETQQKLGEVFVFRHYFIKLENKELNRNIRKLGVGISSKNVKVPDLSKHNSVAEFISQSGGPVSESEMSDMEGTEGATINLTQPLKELPGSTGKTAVRLVEIGPRMTLQLIKIQEGVHTGTVLYHRYVTRTKEELFEIEKKRAERLKLKEKRREQQLKNVENKKKLKENHKKVCLEGMEAKGQLKKDDSDNEEVENQEENVEDISGSEHEEIDDIESDDNANEESEIDDEDEISDDDEDGLEEDDDDEDGIEQDDDPNGIEEVNDSLDDEADSVSDDIEAADSQSDDLFLDGDSEIESEDDVEVYPVITGNSQKRSLPPNSKMCNKKMKFQ